MRPRRPRLSLALPVALALIAACESSPGTTDVTTGSGGTGGENTGGTSGPGTGGAPGTGAGGQATGTGGTASGGSVGTAGTAGASGSGGGAAGTGGAAGSTGAGGTGGAPGAEILPGTGVTALFPRPGAQGVCPDPSLRITFNGAPTLGAAGRIQVFDAAQTATPITSVDLAAPTVADTIGGGAFTIPRPVFVDGNVVVISLRSRGLGYGRTFYVTVDAGAITGPRGALAITGATTWRFSTAAAAPASLATIAVSADGAGSFCSVQGALDALPAASTAAARLNIAAGTYHEIIHFTGKSNVTIHGQDRHQTIIAATNNNNLNMTSAGRALIGIDNVSGLVVENLTIHNLTPQGGSQAEALRLSGCNRCVVRDADILSLQDTVQWSGVIYASNCLIAGNVDFIWGNGVVYFNNCEIRQIGRAGYVVQARNAATAFGYVFVDSRLTSDPVLPASTVLARTDGNNATPASHVAYINCQLGAHISAAGWLLSGGTATAALRFWEYQSVTPAGAPVNIGQRLNPGSRQLTAAEAAMMRDPTIVLGGWQPPM